MPKWREIERYFNDPEILTVEILFLFLTLCNVFVMYKLFVDVIPYPIFVTWFQLLQGLCMATILGELGKEYPKFAYFPKVEINNDLLKKLFFQTLVYTGMLVLLNIVLSKMNCIATFPIAICFTVVLHHITRFIGCGEEYLTLRWISMLLIFISFVMGCTDEYIISVNVLPYALLYACFSAAFRGCYLQKIMHIVEGKGNMLHNHQHVIAVCTLPILWIICGEWRFFMSMPYNFFYMRTWQMWGCLFTVGFLPFLKNIISNRLIRKTGQPAWRILEIISIFLVFIVGMITSNITCTLSFKVCVAMLLLLCGRGINMIDVIVNTQDNQSSSSTTVMHKQPTADYDMQSRAESSQKPFLSAIEEDEKYYDREESMPV